MKRLLSGVVALAFVTHVAAQESATKSVPPVQPPPEMDAAAAAKTAPAQSNAPTIPLANSDAEAKAAAAAEAQATAERAKALASPTLPEASKPLDSPGLPPEVQRAAEATELPVVTVRQEGNETIKEYRKRGKLYFVGVLSNEGPTKLYVNNVSDIPPDMRKLSAPSGAIEPVYFKLYEWK